MMDRQQKPARRLHTGIEPHRRNHHSSRRRKPALGRRRRFRNAGPQPRLIKPANVDPAQAVAGTNRPGRRHLQAPWRGRPGQSQPQRKSNESPAGALGHQRGCGPDTERQV